MSQYVRFSLTGVLSFPTLVRSLYQKMLTSLRQG